MRGEGGHEVEKRLSFSTGAKAPRGLKAASVF